MKHISFIPRLSDTIIYNKCTEEEGKMEEKQMIHEIVMEKADTISEINRAVWDYAEFGYQEKQSAEKMKAVLRQEGFEVEEG